jgi:hypothetical protein
MILIRRLLVLLALFFWQGGFTFYASVVVPVAQSNIGHLRQGFITRQVTVYLNLAGAAALVLLLGDLLVTPKSLKWRRRCRWLLWGGMALTLLTLFWLHGEMNELLVPRGRIIRDHDAFRALHRLYLWISTVQWACALLYLPLTLAVWRSEDRLRARNTAPDSLESSFRTESVETNV